MPDVTVLVIGDIMLDRFVYGDVERISPESPVPVLKISRESKMLGGAGNVLSNLSGLQTGCEIISVIGNDEEGAQVRALAENLGAKSDGFIVDESRPTTIKTRYLARNQQLLRTDFEKSDPVAKDVEDKALSLIEAKIKKVQSLILSDYGKGFLTKDLIRNIIDIAQKHNVPVLVDPKGFDYSIYAGASVVTPNKKELAEATGGMATNEDDQVVKAAEKLIETSGIHSVVATRSQDGMTIIQKEDKGFSQPAHLKTAAKEVFDVSGAGDTVIATVAAALAAGAPLIEAAALANVAGGIVVSKIGTASIRASELMDAQNKSEFSIQTSPVGDMASIDRARQARIYNADEAIDQIQKWRARGLKVGFTNGCFDLVHYGHVNYLNQARNKCDRLIVGLNHDASVKLLKGPDRPLNDQQARATVIGALGSVDMVVFFGAEKEGEDNTPCNLIAKLQPDIFFKGGDYKIEDLPEAKIVQGYGGSVSIMPLYEGYSTTGTIKKMKTDAA